MRQKAILKCFQMSIVKQAHYQNILEMFLRYVAIA